MDASCYVNKWLIPSLLDPFNCTVPYLKVPGISNNTKICDPLTIVRNYNDMIRKKGVRLKDERCILGCTKWEYDITFIPRTSVWRNAAEYRFVLTIGFDELQYEHVREISVGCKA